MVNKEELYKEIKNNSYSNCETIILGELVEIHIHDLCADIYKYRPQDEITDELSEEDYITTVYL